MKIHRWETINWIYISSKVTNLQTKIYEASKMGNLYAVHVYQNTIVNMHETKLLSVRKISQDNRGKRTAGVDGVKILNGKSRLELAEKISLDGKTKAILRIWIDKPGKKEKRPLGIPTIEDRAKQQLAKFALEPQWEALFEENSYGFRPGRSTMDAVNSAHRCLLNGERYILNGDIRKCFDRISHDKLLKKLKTTKTISSQIHAWLKAGILDPSISTMPEPNDQGTPQGGIISPLLSNVALHGLETTCMNNIRPILRKLKLGKEFAQRIHVIRYADDFIVIHPRIEVIEAIRNHLETWLFLEMNLELSQEKTFISSTLNPITHNGKLIKPGFNFLGFRMKIFSSKTYPGKNSKGVPVGFRPKLTPSFEALTSHNRDLKTVIDKFRGIPQSALISKLAPIINGWTQYYKYSSSARIFSSADNTLFHMLYDWACRRHPAKGRKWVLFNYFHQYKRRKWVFSCYPDKANIKTLPSHFSRKMEKYVRTKKSFSPFDPEQVSKVENFKLNKRNANLFKKQRGICRWCLQKFSPGDVTEIHHTLGINHPQRDYEVNLWLIHGHCHDELHAMFKGFEFPYKKVPNK